MKLFAGLFLLFAVCHAQMPSEKDWSVWQEFKNAQVGARSACILSRPMHRGSRTKPTWFVQLQNLDASAIHVDMQLSAADHKSRISGISLPPWASTLVVAGKSDVGCAAVNVKITVKQKG